MPYNPMTQYRGDSYVFQGGRDTATALSGWLENFLNQQKAVANAGKSAQYAVKADPSILQEAGLHPDEFDNLGARDQANIVTGVMQGRGAKQRAAEAQAQIQLRQAEAAKAQTEADSTSGMPQFAQFLQEELQQPGTATTPSWPPPGNADWNSFLQGNGPVQTSGTTTGAQPAGPPPMSQAVLRALGRVQNLNPRVAAALATKILPGILQNSGDDSAPEVIQLQGPNGTKLPVIYKRGSKQFQVDPTAVVEARNQAAQELLQAKNALHQQLIGNGFKPATNSATGEVIPDVYTDPTGKTIDLRSGIDKMTGTPSATTPATTPAAAGARVTVSKGGKKFTVPQEQLSDALKQGYTQVK